MSDSMIQLDGTKMSHDHASIQKFHSNKVSLSPMKNFQIQNFKNIYKLYRMNYIIFRRAIICINIKRFHNI